MVADTTKHHFKFKNMTPETKQARQAKKEAAKAEKKQERKDANNWMQFVKRMQQKGALIYS